jgi:hypothetical protein
MWVPWLPRSPQFHFFATIGLNLASLAAFPGAVLGQHCHTPSNDEQK